MSEDDNKPEQQDSDGDQPKLTKEELIQKAKKEFDLILRVRMNGPFRMEKQICEHFGVKMGGFHSETLEKIGKVCKSGDTSRGSTYVERGFLYGAALFRAESGQYVASYKFLCKA